VGHHTDRRAIAEKNMEVLPDERDLGRGKHPLSAAELQIADCALLVGWDDPRVVELVTRFEREEKRFRDAANAAKPAQP